MTVDSMNAPTGGRNHHGIAKRALIPPLSRDLPIGSRLRFAVGEPNGLRSETWVIVGGTRGRDVYVGASSNMGFYKLSLHNSGRWRLAQVDRNVTDEGGKVDRVLMRFDPPTPVADGWRFATRVLIPTSCLGQPFPEKPTRSKEWISWWDAPFLGRTLSFNIFIAEEEPFFPTTERWAVTKVMKITQPTTS